MPRKETTIKLISVNFVPTIHTLDGEGKRIRSRTMIGQLAFDCDALPPDIQINLRAIMAEAYQEEMLSSLINRSKTRIKCQQI